MGDLNVHWGVPVIWDVVRILAGKRREFGLQEQGLPLDAGRTESGKCLANPWLVIMLGLAGGIDATKSLKVPADRYERSDVPKKVREKVDREWHKYFA